MTLNSTVFWTLTTKNRAAANYPPPPYTSATPGPGYPTMAGNPWGPPLDPTSLSDTLILYHNGHETQSCMPNYDGVVDYFNELGYDTMEFMMPLLGCNAVPGIPSTHWWFLPYEVEGYHTFKFFIEPLAQAVHYAKSTLGYKTVGLVGLSGGGWTTTVASAVISDIDFSIPIAGSIPKWRSPLLPDMWLPDLPEGRNPFSIPPQSIFEPPPTEGAGGDYEQEQGRPLYSPNGTTLTGIGYAELYLMATALGSRPQLQILHDYDSCCFRAQGLVKNITRYGEVVRNASLKHSTVGRLSGQSAQFHTAITEGNYHQVNLRDKVVVAVAVERFRACRDANGTNGCWSTILTGLPFDLLK